MSNFLESRTIRTVLWVLGGLIVIFLVFGLGIAVGYSRAGFAVGFDRNYFKLFYGAPPGGMAGVMAPPGPVAIHGTVGTVIDVSTSSVSIKNQEGNEQSVVISSGTAIRSGDSTVTGMVIAIGDTIAVIGEPDSDGQIDARFIRILSAVTSTPN